MHCREVRRNLDRFARQEVAPAERDRIEAHLESCAACRASLARLRRLEGMLAALPAPPVPEGLAARVVARANQQQAAAAARPIVAMHAEQSVWTRIRATGATCAAVAAGLMLGLLLGRATWQSGPARPARQVADMLASTGFEYVTEPGGDSLAEAYLQLTTAPDR
jgi:anti-sigma factor RsiW